MSSKILIAIAMFCFATAAASAQIIQLDPSELDSSANSANDAKLVAVAPLPADVQQEFDQVVKDIHFDFDKSDLRPEDRAILAADAEWLKAHPDVMITLEGDTDERGDIIYNLVLSGERAMTAKDALVDLGVAPDRIALPRDGASSIRSAHKATRAAGARIAGLTFPPGHQQKKRPVWLHASARATSQIPKLSPGRDVACNVSFRPRASRCESRALRFVVESTRRR